MPQCAQALEKVFLAAGAPSEVYTNLFPSNAQAAMSIADIRVHGAAFTGSEPAGAAVAAEAGKALKKSTLEQGGSDAFSCLKMQTFLNRFRDKLENQFRAIPHAIPLRSGRYAPLEHTRSRPWSDQHCSYMGHDPLGWSLITAEL